MCTHLITVSISQVSPMIVYNNQYYIIINIIITSIHVYSVFCSFTSQFIQDNFC